MIENKKIIMLSFVGAQDPMNKEGDEGPILSALHEIVEKRKEPVGKIILFSILAHPVTEANHKQLVSKIKSEFKGIEVPEVIVFKKNNPTNHEDIYRELKSNLDEIVEKNDAEFSILSSSGTPAMQMVWMLVVANGVLPAKLLYKSKPSEVPPGTPLIREIDHSIIHVPFKKTICDIKDDEVSSVADMLGIVGDSTVWKNTLKEAAQFAKSNMSVLLLGETGTGKELIAKFIHNYSGRKGEFVDINCAGLDDNLANCRLFGHTRGAYTGAVKEQTGVIERADKGTLFLDEAANLSLSVQANLLRVLDDRKVQKTGETDPSKAKIVDVRFIAAMNKEITELIDEEKFRNDLYYRFHGATIRLPPLRERRADIGKLAVHFVKTKESGKTLSADAMRKISSYNWPGNIRELQNTIKRAVALCQDNIITPEHIRLDEHARKKSLNSVLNNLPEPSETYNLEENLSEIEKYQVEKALEKTGRNKSKARRLLGFNTDSSWKRIEKKFPSLFQ